MPLRPCGSSSAVIEMTALVDRSRFGGQALPTYLTQQSSAPIANGTLKLNETLGPTDPQARELRLRLRRLLSATPASAGAM